MAVINEAAIERLVVIQIQRIIDEVGVGCADIDTERPEAVQCVVVVGRGEVSTLVAQRVLVVVVACADTGAGTVHGIETMLYPQVQLRALDDVELIEVAVVGDESPLRQILPGKTDRTVGQLVHQGTAPLGGAAVIAQVGANDETVDLVAPIPIELVGTDLHPIAEPGQGRGVSEQQRGGGVIVLPVIEPGIGIGAEQRHLRHRRQLALPAGHQRALLRIRFVALLETDIREPRSDDQAVDCRQTRSPVQPRRDDRTHLAVAGNIGTPSVGALLAHLMVEYQIEAARYQLPDQIGAAIDGRLVLFMVVQVVVILSVIAEIDPDALPIEGIADVKARNAIEIGAFVAAFERYVVVMFDTGTDDDVELGGGVDQRHPQHQHRATRQRHPRRA